MTLTTKIARHRKDRQSASARDIAARTATAVRWLAPRLLKLAAGGLIIAFLTLWLAWGQLERLLGVGWIQSGVTRVLENKGLQAVAGAELIRLRKSNAKLSKTNAKLRKSNTKLSKTNAKLRKSNTKLSKTNTKLRKSTAALREFHRERVASTRKRFAGRALKRIGLVGGSSLLGPLAATTAYAVVEAETYCQEQESLAREQAILDETSVHFDSQACLKSARSDMEILLKKAPGEFSYFIKDQWPNIKGLWDRLTQCYWCKPPEADPAATEPVGLS